MIRPHDTGNTGLHMRFRPTHWLADGKGYNRGQSATLIEIEHPSDFDVLCANMARTRYYDRAYFQGTSGYKPHSHVAHFWLVAHMLGLLRPRRALDVGCGRGDLISLLHRQGIDVNGLDFSEDALRMAWPNVADRLWLGDLQQVCLQRQREAKRFDLLLGLDIWEHLHPAALEGSIQAVSTLATSDALAFFVVPAFGADRSFAEQFPLEFEENRACFEQHVPFRFLTAEMLDPPIPVSGHLIWATALWWERQFEACGWQRVLDFDPLLHRVFDPCCPTRCARSSFSADRPRLRRNGSRTWR
jgi:SAM-dependent methyltransferase